MKMFQIQNLLLKFKKRCFIAPVQTCGLSTKDVKFCTSCLRDFKEIYKFMKKSVVDVQTNSWESEVQSGKLVMVCFFANTCPSCKAAFPVLEELAEENSSKVKIAALNIEENPEVASAYKVSIIPTFMFFKGKQKLHEIITLVPKQELQNSIERL